MDAPFNIFENKIDYAILGRIRCEFFQQVPVLIKEKKEAQSIQNGYIVLGLLAGCVYHVDHLLHETAHLIEIDDERVLEPGWGLKYGTWIEFPGHKDGGWYEALTPQHIEREIRVCAIQWMLVQHFRTGTNLSQMTASCIYLPDTFTVNQLAPNHSFEPFETEFHQFFQTQVGQLAQTLSFNSLQAEWQRKMKMLKEQSPQAVEFLS
jgi:hypothetical protein